MNTAMRKQYTSPRPTTGRRGGRVQKGHRNLGRASATVCNQERCTAPSVTLRDTHGVIAKMECNRGHVIGCHTSVHISQMLYLMI